MEFLNAEPPHKAISVRHYQPLSATIPTSVAVVSPSAAVSVRSLSVCWPQKGSGSRRKAGTESKPSGQTWSGTGRTDHFLSLWFLCVILPSHKNTSSSKAREGPELGVISRANSQEDLRRTQLQELGSHADLSGSMSQGNQFVFPTPLLQLLTKNLKQDLLKMFNANKMDVYIYFILVIFHISKVNENVNLQKKLL